MAANEAVSQAAFLSVADRHRIDEFGALLPYYDFGVYATEGTAAAMPEVPVLGGYPELLIQFDEYRHMAMAPKPAQAMLLASIILRQAFDEAGVPGQTEISLLCINLRQDKHDAATVVDPGGSALLMAGMCAGIPTVSNPELYDDVLEWLEEGQPVNPELRAKLNFSNYANLTIHSSDLSLVEAKDLPKLPESQSPEEYSE